MPPPPADALTRIGKPIFLASATREDFGRVGTPSFSQKFLELILSPIKTMVSEFGPIHLIPASFTFFENSAFSDKKPYPGCIASTFKAFAFDIIVS